MGNSEPDSRRQDRLMAAMEEVCAAVDHGDAIDRSKLLERYEDIARELSECLESLDLIHQAADQHNSDASSSYGAHPDIAGVSATVGDFRLLREIGRGGMGVVYEAQQLSSGGRVALKILPFIAVLDERRRQRFKLEAQAAAMLRHPGIVGVHCVACDRNVHHYAMDLIDGASLADVIEQLRANSRKREHPSDQPGDSDNSHPNTRWQVGEIFRKWYDGDRRGYFQFVSGLAIRVAQALQHAHDQGIIHRDIKPSNLLVDTAGSIWITDFGLAQVPSEQTLTMSGDLIGTLRYMSPEQARGAKLIDTRSDIYSLGVTLYELLSLRPALKPSDRQTILRQLEESEPTPLRSIDRGIPVELETIVLKAMAKRPDDRYQDAAELANDLQRFVDRQPIRAKRPSAFVRTVRWARRHRSVTVLLMLLICMICILSVVGPLVAVKYFRLAAAEREARQQSQDDQDELRRLLKHSLSLAGNALDRYPNMNQLRLQLLRETAQKLEQMHRQRPLDQDLSVDLAIAYRDLGRFLCRLGQLDEGLSCLKQAELRLGESLASDNPRPDDLYELSEVLWLIANRIEDDDRSEAIEQLRRGVDALELALRMRPNESRYKKQLASLRFGVGRMLYESGHVSEGAALVDTTSRELLRYADLDPSDHAQVGFALFCRWFFARTLIESGQVYAGASELERALEEWEPHIGLVSHEWLQEYEVGYADAKRVLGNAMIQLRRLDDAEDHLAEARERLDRVIDEWPGFDWARFCLAEVTVDQSAVLIQQDRWDEAEQVLRRSLEVSGGSAVAFRWSEELHSQAMLRLGHLCFAAGRREESRSYFQQLLRRSKLEDDEQRVPCQAELTAALMSPFKEDRNPAWVIAQLEQHFRPEFGRDWQLLGLAHLRNADYSQALHAIQRSVSLRNGGDAFDDYLLAIAHQQLGQVDEASSAYRRARERAEGPLSFFLYSDPRQLDEWRAEAERLGCATLSQPLPSSEGH